MRLNFIKIGSYISAALFLAMALGLAIPTQIVRAATITVCASGCDYTTIQAAVDAAVADDTIDVAAGVYDEQVVINGKNLTLQGAGDTTIIRPSSPAILTTLYTYPAGTFWPGTVMASALLVTNTNSATVMNLKVDGVNITTLPAGSSRVAGILYGETAGSIDNVTVTTMVVDGYVTRSYGIDLSAVGTARIVEVQNSDVTDWSRNGIQAQGASLTADIHDNTLTGPGNPLVASAVPNGILFIHGVGGNATNNTITAAHSSLTDARSSGILFYDPLTAGIVVEGNNISDVDDGVLLGHNANDVTVQLNNLHGNLEVGVHLEDGATNNTITGNTITGNAMAGIRFAGATDPGTPDSPPGTGNVAHDNSITGNGIGVADYDTQVFDASSNWWGAVSGPGSVGPGTGDTVTTKVDYSPWCVNAACSIITNVDVYIATTLTGGYFIPSQGSLRVNYAGVDSGPVRVVSTNTIPIIAAIRDAWAVNGVTTSFSQLMGLPAGQLSDKYVFPGYNNVTLNEQLRIGNVDTVPSTVTVTIGGMLQGTYTLQPNEAVRVNYAGLDSGPVIVQGTANVDIISAIREAWAVNGMTTSFVQLMGLPATQLSDKYVFPAYNNVTLNEQLRIANVDIVPSTVTVTIGGMLQGTYILGPNQAVRVNYAGLDSGPVIVQGTANVDIISSIRDAWANNGTTTSFAQLMGLPAGQLSDQYVFPAYNNVTLNEQLRIGNVDTVPSTVTVTIGGMLRGTYILGPDEAVRVNYAGLDSGPVVVDGTNGVHIISAIREAWAVNGMTTSFVQLMGLPFEQLSTTYLFPAYNNVTLNEQLRIAVP